MIGIVTWMGKEGALAQRIDRFARLGFEAVSLLPRDAAPLCRGETPEVEDAILKNALAVTIHGGMTSSQGDLDEALLFSEFESYLKWQRRTSALASVNYDAACVKTDGGTEYGGWEMHDVLLKMLEMSGNAGFTVGVEDWPRDAQMFEAVADLAKFPHYGILIDLGHMNMRIGNDKPGAPYPTETAKRYLDGISLPINEVHIHNNDGVHDQHAPLDQGTADIASVADMIRSGCSRAVFTVEIIPNLCGLPEEDCVRSSVDALRVWRSLI